MEIGNRVEVTRQVGKNGQPHQAIGQIERFSNTITVDGEATAVVRFSEVKGDRHYFPISRIKVLPYESPALETCVKSGVGCVNACGGLCKGGE